MGDYAAAPIDVVGIDVFDLARSVERELLREQMNSLIARYNALTPAGAGDVVADGLDWATQYVHPDGSDSYAGRYPDKPKATIEAAYGDLPEGGVVELAPHQDHDVGDGLSLDRRKHASFISRARPRRNRGTVADPSPCPRIVSSTGAATLIDCSVPASSVNGAGFEWVNLDFIPSTSTTTIIDGTAVGHTRVVNCGAYHDYADVTQNPFTFIDVDPPGALGDDNAWWRIVDNYVRGGALVNAAGDGVNQWVIRDNVAFDVNSTADAIYIKNGHRCVTRDNNLEGAGYASGIKLELSTACRIDGDAGEATDPFIIIDSSNGCLITPMGISNAVGATLVRFVNGSGDNVVVASVATGLSNLYTTAAWIDDQTVAKENWVFGSSGNVTAVNSKYLQRVLGLKDAKFVPTAEAGAAFIYVDNADGDLKVKFGDGTVKTLATDT